MATTYVAQGAQIPQKKLTYIERLVIAFDKLSEQHKRDATLWVEGMAAAAFDKDTDKKPA